MRLGPSGKGSALSLCLLFVSLEQFGAGLTALTDDLKRLQPLSQLVFLILRCFGVVVGEQRVLEDCHFKLAGVELLEDGSGEAEVVIKHGYFERPCHIDRL